MCVFGVVVFFRIVFSMDVQWLLLDFDRSLVHFGWFLVVVWCLFNLCFEVI